MNPIIHRELLEVLRTRKAIALQLSLAVACALLILARWPSSGTADLSGVRSIQVLRVFGYGLLAGVLLLVPAFPAVALVREKINGTLALLLNSPLRPWSIYIGKLGGVLGFTAILLIMTAPAAAACYLLGGTGAQAGITSLYGVVAVSALQLSTLALFVSCHARSTDSALRITYALVLVLGVLVLGPYELSRGKTGFLAEMNSWLRCLSPVPAIMEILGQRDVGSHGYAADYSATARYVILALVTSLICSLATIAALNHKLFDRARPPGIMTQDRGKEERILRRVLFLFFFDPQRRSGPMSLWVNPVMVKEFRSRRFGRSHWTMRLIGVCAILSLGLSHVSVSGVLGWGVEIIGGALVLLQIALLILFAPSLAAGLVSGERESGAWQLLRMTPLSPGVILRGKLLSVALPLLLLFCATLPGYIAMIAFRPALIWQVQRVVLCLGLTAVFAVLVSFTASTLFRSTAAATTASYLTLLAICVGPLLVWLGQGAPFGHDTVQAVLCVDPVAAALQAADAPGFAQYEIVLANWWIIGSSSVVLFLFSTFRIWQLYQPE